ncbi:MAG: 50S ribosomal protein L4 [Nitrospirota bacterium]|nr:50S ribosomal protein L4 [Nitrospirota bacterium]
MASIDVYAQSGKKSGSVEVSDTVFARPENSALLHEVLIRELASRRQGTHATKTRGEVSGGGKKPWRQKGTGRARSGSNRSPLWKGGGTALGPQPRDYKTRMPRKKVRSAMHVALSDALRDGRLWALSALELKVPKTSGFVDVMESLSAPRGTVLVVSELTENVSLASRNVNSVAVVEVTDLTPYDVVTASRLLIEKDALAFFEESSNVA